MSKLISVSLKQELMSHCIALLPSRGPSRDRFLVFNEGWGDALGECMKVIDQVGEHVHQKD